MKRIYKLLTLMIILVTLGVLFALPSNAADRYVRLNVYENDVLFEEDAANAMTAKGKIGGVTYTGVASTQKSDGSDYYYLFTIPTTVSGTMTFTLEDNGGDPETLPSLTVSAGTSSLTTSAYYYIVGVWAFTDDVTEVGMRTKDTAGEYDYSINKVRTGSGTLYRGQRIQVGNYALDLYGTATGVQPTIYYHDAYQNTTETKVTAVTTSSSGNSYTTKTTSTYTVTKAKGAMYFYIYGQKTGLASVYLYLDDAYLTKETTYSVKVVNKSDSTKY